MRQAQIVSISRNPVFYEREPLSDADLKLMRRMGITALYGKAQHEQTSAWAPNLAVPVAHAGDHTPGQGLGDGYHLVFCGCDRLARPACAAWRLSILMDGKGCWRDNVFIEQEWRSIRYDKIGCPGARLLVLGLPYSAVMPMRRISLRSASLRGFLS